MSNIKALAQEVNAEYGNDIASSVKEFIPKMIKSIKDPRKSINPAFNLREKLTRRRLLKVARRYGIDSTDPVEISARMNKKEKYKMSLLMVIADALTNSIGMTIIIKMFERTKIAAALGKILVNTALHVAYMKAGIDSSKLNDLDDRQKLIQFTALNLHKPIIEYMNDNVSGLDELGMKDVVTQDIDKAISVNNITYGILGATSLGLAIGGSVNEEASKAAAEKYNFSKEYFIVFNIGEFSKYVYDGSKNGADMKNILALRSMAVMMHGVNTLLHKKGLGWAAYVIHFVWNLFAASIGYLIHKKDDMIRIINATS